MFSRIHSCVFLPQTGRKDLYQPRLRTLLQLHGRTYTVLQPAQPVNCCKGKVDWGCEVTAAGRIKCQKEKDLAVTLNQD